MANTPRAPFRTAEHQRLRSAALCLALKQRFTELRARDYPDGGASDALNLLETLLTIVHKRITGLTDEQTLVMTSEVVIYLGETLEYFDNAGTDQTPRGLVCLLKGLYTRLKRDSNLLAWPQASYNFTIRSFVEFLKELFQNFGSDAETDAAFLKYEGPQDFVSFPRVERDSVLMYAIFGHELGHEIAEEFLKEEAGKSEHKAQEKWIRDEIIKALGGTPNIGELQNAILRVFELRKRALEELISDSVGVYLFGPSALFAGHEIYMWSGLDVIPSDKNGGYPPGRMRIRVSLEVSQEELQLTFLEDNAEDKLIGAAFIAGLSLVDHLVEIAGKDDDKQILGSDSLVKVAYDWVLDTLPAAKAFAREKVGPALYLPGTQNEEVPKLVERLKNGLPPNEIGNSLNPTLVDERSCVLAAWLASLEASQSASTGNLKTQELFRLNEKTLRALEYVILQRNYKAGTSSL